MNTEMADKLNPEKTPDAIRQQTLEAIVFSQNHPDPEIWRVIIPSLEREPVQWIQQLGIRVLKRLHFEASFVTAACGLFETKSAALRFQTAGLMRQIVDRLVAEKKSEDLVTFESELLPILSAQLKRDDIVAEPKTWLELYKTVAELSGSEAVNKAMLEALPNGGEAAITVFAQHVQGNTPEESLNAILEGCNKGVADDSVFNSIRALKVLFPKGKDSQGYAVSDGIVSALIKGLSHASENVRRESCDVLASRAKEATKTGKGLPLEEEAWQALYTLYKNHLPMSYARDKDHANLALGKFPITQERMELLLEIMRGVDEEMQKQSVVSLIGVFKTKETRIELLRLLRENFAGLKLAAQKITLESISVYLPDEEIEIEMDKLLEGKGLHADVLGKLGEKLFVASPSLKPRLMKWLGLNERTKRPMVERFELPMMHIIIIQSAKILGTDPEIREKLHVLEPLLMLNDAKVKLHDIVKRLPKI